MAGLRVAIDAGLLAGRHTGDRTYWRLLIEALSRSDAGDTYLLYTPVTLAGSLPEGLPGVEVRVVPGKNRRWWSLVRLPAAARADGADVLHVQYTLSPRAATPAVTTVHDVSFLIGPEWFRPKDRWLLRLSVPRSMRRAARVITVSETSRRDILARVPLPSEKVVATLLAPPPEFRPVEGAARMVEERLGLGQPYALVVGTLQPRKNQLMAVRAFEAAKREAGLPHVLAVAGKEGWGAAPSSPAARLLGYVPDELLSALYSAADLFLFPSLYEGFGLPVVEAMACGCPVLCSDGGALPEVAGGAAEVVPATDEEAWREAVGALLIDPARREELRARGLERAKMMSWRDTARLTSQVYEEVAQWSRRSC